MTCAYGHLNHAFTHVGTICSLPTHVARVSLATSHHPASKPSVFPGACDHARNALCIETIRDNASSYIPVAAHPPLPIPAPTWRSTVIAMHLSPANNKGHAPTQNKHLLSQKPLTATTASFSNKTLKKHPRACNAHPQHRHVIAYRHVSPCHECCHLVLCSTSRPEHCMTHRRDVVPTTARKFWTLRPCRRSTDIRFILGCTQLDSSMDNDQPESLSLKSGSIKWSHRRGKILSSEPPAVSTRSVRPYPASIYRIYFYHILSASTTIVIWVYPTACHIRCTVVQSPLVLVQHAHLHCLSTKTPQPRLASFLPGQDNGCIACKLGTIATSLMRTRAREAGEIHHRL